MKYLNIAAAIILIISLTSCSNDQVDVETADHTHETSEAMMLNDGEKWHVDENMMVFIRAMENDVNSISVPSEEACTELVEKLNENIGELTSNCTMTGKAHDELHKWLVPYMNLVKSLEENANDQDDKGMGNACSNLMRSFDTFNSYFE